jgi:ATP-dependent helicase/nuclease subunit A
MNAKKFISIIGEIESKGEPPLIMRERVLRLTEKDEAKANVDSYALDSVKIITIHAAKGLQFPVVFIPYLDEENWKTNKVIIHHKEGSFKINFSENEEIREIQKQKDIEEEKRLFYVATTRAMDHLFMSGFIKNDEQLKGRLKFINDAFNLTENIHLPFNLKKISITSENDLNEILQNQDFINEFDYTKKFSHSEYFIFPQKVPDLKCISWHDVTEEIEEIKRKHTLEWDAVGQVLHSTFDAISRSQVSLNEIEQFIESITKKEILLPEKQKQIKALAIQEIEKLKKSPYLYKIIAPRENSFSEIPFIIEIEGKVYSGRIDRIIIENNIAHLYDYKTYPASEKEIKKLKEAYSEQLNIYRLATEKLFGMQVKAYILFSYIPVIIEID